MRNILKINNEIKRFSHTREQEKRETNFNNAIKKSNIFKPPNVSDRTYYLQVRANKIESNLCF